MSIKADRWIKRQCTRPTHFYYDSQQRRHLAAVNQYGEVFELTDAVHNPGQSFDRLQELSAEELKAWAPMIEPFHEKQQRTRLVKDLMQDHPLEVPAISFGNSSYGYDVRVADEFKIFTNVNGGRVDPKNFDDTNYVIKKGSELVIPPNGFALARTVEYFRIPRNVLVVCLGKSTYARCGIIVNVTPLEPEWEGHVTLEFSNTTSLPAVVYANEGVAQFLFFESDEECETSYKDRAGKYQGQTGVTDPRI